jgi:antimicrobial peptide system SdpA family protein
MMATPLKDAVTRHGAGLSTGRLRCLALTAIGTIACWATVALYAVHGTMPANALTLPGESKARIALFLPEAWKFFTRNPREEQLHVMRREANGTWSNATASVNADPSNLFGLRRASRARWVEEGLMIDVPDAAWTKCEEAPSACLSRAATYAQRENPTPAPSVCGTLGFVQQRPVPWAWARSRETLIMPSRVFVMEVTCP